MDLSAATAVWGRSVGETGWHCIEQHAAALRQPRRIIKMSPQVVRRGAACCLACTSLDPTASGARVLLLAVDNHASRLAHRMAAALLRPQDELQVCGRSARVVQFACHRASVFLGLAFGTPSHRYSMSSDASVGIRSHIQVAKPRLAPHLAIAKTACAPIAPVSPALPPCTGRDGCVF